MRDFEGFWWMVLAAVGLGIASWLVYLAFFASAVMLLKWLW